MDSEDYIIPAEVADWVKTIGCAVTICDKYGEILYMNDAAKHTYIKHGNLIGKNLMPCHSERSQKIIRQLIATGKTNTYTVKKNGIKKLIYQTPWRRDGEIAGLAEISIPLPAEMSHYDRDDEKA